jgi:hypothetical protein
MIMILHGSTSQKTILNIKTYKFRTEQKRQEQRGKFTTAPTVKTFKKMGARKLAKK